MDVSVVIPTFMGEKTLKPLLIRLTQEGIGDIIVIDSQSKDKTLDIAKAFTNRVYVIKKEQFNHGLTRNFGLELASCEIVVFLTQDAIPQKNSIRVLANSFKDSDVAIAYGRQLPHKNAIEFSKHLRYFNYPDYSIKKTLDKKDEFGMKLAFNSNSFAAYRKSVIKNLGGFVRLDFGEDVYMAALALKNGYAVFYNHEAIVYHSHNYSLKEEFLRYIEVGKFYKSQNWIEKEFGKTQDEGFRYVKSQLQYLVKTKKLYYLPSFVIRDILKFVAFKLA